MRREVKMWFEQAEDDFMSAKIIFDGEAYYVAVFLCHQAVEKGLKALYLKLNEGRIPRVHSLISLGQQVGAPEKFHGYLRDLTPQYITTRYPDVASDLPKNLYDRSSALKWINKTETFFKWLRKQII
jgi:HEPN domain-containing protein